MAFSFLFVKPAGYRAAIGASSASKVVEIRLGKNYAAPNTHVACVRNKVRPEDCCLDDFAFPTGFSRPDQLRGGRWPSSYRPSAKHQRAGFDPEIRRTGSCL